VGPICSTQHRSPFVLRLRDVYIAFRSGWCEHRYGDGALNVHRSPVTKFAKGVLAPTVHIARANNSAIRELIYGQALHTRKYTAAPDTEDFDW